MCTGYRNEPVAVDLKPGQEKIQGPESLIHVVDQNVEELAAQADAMLRNPH